MPAHPILDIALANRPFAKAAANAVINAVGRAAEKNTNEMTKAEVPANARDIATELVPVMVNAANKEPAIQSRVGWGGTAAVLGAAAILANALYTRTFDPEVLVPALVTLAGGLYALYGRFKTGLKPLFNRFSKKPA